MSTDQPHVFVLGLQPYEAGLLERRLNGIPAQLSFDPGRNKPHVPASADFCVATKQVDHSTSNAIKQHFGDHFKMHKGGIKRLERLIRNLVANMPKAQPDPLVGMVQYKERVMPPVRQREQKQDRGDPQYCAPVAPAATPPTAGLSPRQLRNQRMASAQKIKHLWEELRPAANSDQDCINALIQTSGLKLTTVREYLRSFNLIPAMPPAQCAALARAAHARLQAQRRQQAEAVVVREGVDASLLRGGRNQALSTGAVITQLWQIHRKRSRTAHSCAVKVAQQINYERLTLRPLSVETVMNYAVRLKLRRPLHVPPPRQPNILEPKVYREIMNALPPETPKVGMDSLTAVAAAGGVDRLVAAVKAVKALTPDEQRLLRALVWE